MRSPCCSAAPKDPVSFSVGCGVVRIALSAGWELAGSVGMRGLPGMAGGGEKGERRKAQEDGPLPLSENEKVGGGTVSCGWAG